MINNGYIIAILYNKPIKPTDNLDVAVAVSEDPFHWSLLRFLKNIFNKSYKRWKQNDIYTYNYIYYINYIV